MKNNTTRHFFFSYTSLILKEGAQIRNYVSGGHVCILDKKVFVQHSLTAVSAGKVLALPKKDSLGNKVVLALPYTNTPVALLQYYYTPTLL